MHETMKRMCVIGACNKCVHRSLRYSAFHPALQQVFPAPKHPAACLPASEFRCALQPPSSMQMVADWGNRPLLGTRERRGCRDEKEIKQQARGGKNERSKGTVAGVYMGVRRQNCSGGKAKQSALVSSLHGMCVSRGASPGDGASEGEKGEG